MAAKPASPLDALSEPARAHVAHLARQTGQSDAEVVEAAVLAYRPRADAGPGGMMREDGIPVFSGGPTTTDEQDEAALSANRERDHNGNCADDDDYAYRPA